MILKWYSWGKMRQKNTIYSPEYHVQFQETPDEIRNAKKETAEHSKRDEKQGQGKFRVGKQLKNTGRAN